LDALSRLAEPITVKSLIGSECYATAIIQQLDHVFVNVGLEVFVEMEFLEALRFCLQKRTILQQSMSSQRETKLAIHDHIEKMQSLLDQIEQFDI